MTVRIPPTPINAPQGSAAWLDYHQKVNEYLSQGGQLSWTQLNFSGSNITDITTRNHSALQGIQGGSPGEYYHLTTTQYNSMTNWVNKTAPSGTVVGTTDAQTLDNKKLVAPEITDPLFSSTIRATTISGKATLVAGTANVANTRVTANSVILLTPQNSTGTAGHVRAAANPGVGFTITSSSNTDTSIIGYLIVEPV